MNDLFVGLTMTESVIVVIGLFFGFGIIYIPYSIGYSRGFNKALDNYAQIMDDRYIHEDKD